MPAGPTTLTPSAACPETRPFRCARLISGAAGVARRWLERARQRRALCDLDPDRLHDIGVSRSAAVREAAKPFWRA
jgi:uncharacterized protein YjiS (DUF1127 family)